MLEECIVTKVSNGRAYVGLAPNAQCSGCKACIFGKNKQKVDVPAVMEVECKKGDIVLVDVPQREIIAAPIYLYLMPLLSMLVGLIIGNFINIYVQIILGFGLLFLSFMAIYFIDRVYFKGKKYSPKIVKNISLEEIKND